MARRKVVSFTHGGQTATVYKDPEWQEYVVRIKGEPEADYHTTDRQDAENTARVMIGMHDPLRGYGKVDVTKNYRRERKRAPSSCAAGSYRAKKTKSGHLLTFCCPKGRWDRKRKVCRTAMALQSIGRRRR